MLITASNLKTEGDLQNLMDGKIQELDALLKNIGTLEQFETFKLKAGVQHILEDSDGFGPEQYSKIKEHGFQGAIMDVRTAEKPPFDQWSELIGLFASIMKAGEAAAHKLLF